MLFSRLAKLKTRGFLGTKCFILCSLFSHYYYKHCILIRKIKNSQTVGTLTIIGLLKIPYYEHRINFTESRNSPNSRNFNYNWFTQNFLLRALHNSPKNSISKTVGTLTIIGLLKISYYEHCRILTKKLELSKQQELSL